ncbi:GTP-binding protein Rit2 [Biomphalaria glabrata]|uniref:small monomeric GTPase n=1 Tax=Biomphalaria glabrata TaxID=6526 RepID=A0A2C9K6D1_BIOGL|nr:GTP-binding protein Rit2-like [Biomphalaria glabrata]KAI8789226.1 GTP-binding protein Rit2 [Biomphalaria glabrata]
MSGHLSRGRRKYKLVILGDGGVGKSALVIQFVCHRFLEYHDPTIEDSFEQQCRIDDEPAHLDILDTAGQTEFTAMREQYMRNGEGFILCFSITDRRSFEELITYRNLINRVRAGEEIPIIIAGNKCDLEHKRKVKSEEAMALAQQLGCQYYETSAYLRKCIDDVFHGIVRAIRDKEKEKLQQGVNAKTKPSKIKRLLTSLQPSHLFKKGSTSNLSKE